MIIYKLDLFYDRGNLYRNYLPPPKYNELLNYQEFIGFDNLIIYKYLSVFKEKFKNYELEIHEKSSEKRLDAEMVTPMLWVVSERLKTCLESENVEMDFFPIKVEGERRYLMMWIRIPVITGYETYTSKAKFVGDNKKINFNKAVFRSDILKYYNYKMFCDPTHIYLFVSDDFKRKLEDNNFLFSYEERPVKEIKYNEKKVEKILIEAAKKEREHWLGDKMINRLIACDNYVEKIVKEEGDEEDLKKFRNGIKGNWENYYKRYKNNLMQPLERIRYY
jgi:hypothetical protein